MQQSTTSAPFFTDGETGIERLNDLEKIHREVLRVLNKIPGTTRTSFHLVGQWTYKDLVILHYNMNLGLFHFLYFPFSLQNDIFILKKAMWVFVNTFLAYPI